MTDYFDNHMSEIDRILSLERGADGHPDDDTAFLHAVANIEKRVVDVVMLNTGDREFPSDLREQILNDIALNGLNGYKGLDPHRGVVRRVLAQRTSLLIPALHRDFHYLASQRIQARFGLWTDDPADNLRRRDAHDTRGPSTLKWQDRGNGLSSALDVDEKLGFKAAVHQLSGHFGHEWFITCERLGLKNEKLQAKTLFEAKEEAVDTIQHLARALAFAAAQLTVPNISPTL